MEESGKFANEWQMGVDRNTIQLMDIGVRGDELRPGSAEDN